MKKKSRSAAEGGGSSAPALVLLTLIYAVSVLIWEKADRPYCCELLPQLGELYARQVF